MQRDNYIEIKILELAMKDAKHIFNCAAAKSEAMIVDRILVRVMPALLKHDQKLTADGIKSMVQVFVPDDLYDYIRSVAEELVGCKCVEEPGVSNNV